MQNGGLQMSLGQSCKSSQKPSVILALSASVIWSKSRKFGLETSLRQLLKLCTTTKTTKPLNFSGCQNVATTSGFFSCCH